jgi:ASTRA-associated protein 1
VSVRLPIDGAMVDQPTPWLLHSMDMSALNFCTFAICRLPDQDASREESDGRTKHGDEDSSLLIASPNGLDSGTVDIFQLPTQRRVSQVAPPSTTNVGMVMAVEIFYAKESDTLHLLAGYEDGQVSLYAHKGMLGPAGKWERLMHAKPHSQPVLSLALAPSGEYFVTSSADANIAKYETSNKANNTNAAGATPIKIINTKHAGQQGLTLRSDGKIFATAGWDARVRVYSTKTMKELAVLKWHQDGCYSTAFATVHGEAADEASQSGRTIVHETALDRIKFERSFQAQRMHWLAAGGKDGKISLWDIY